MKLSKLSSAIMLIGLMGGCSSSSDNTPTPPETPPNNTVSLTGSAVKGPLAQAKVEAFRLDYSASDLKGALLATGSTNDQAQITSLALDPADAPFLIVTTATDNTIDLTTGEAPVISTMQTIVTAAQLNGNEPIYATPLTSLAVQVTATNGASAETIDQALENAQGKVKSTLGFGLDANVDIFTTPPVLNAGTTSAAEQNKVAAYRLAVEAVSAVVANAAESTAADDSADDILSALAQDVSDGEIDGQADGQDLPALDEVDVTETPVDDLIIPGTISEANPNGIKVTAITDVISDETSNLGVDVELDDSVEVSPEEVNTVADTDLDGIDDNTDNCIEDANADQLDANSNQIGAVCELVPSASAVVATTAEDTAVAIVFAGSDGADSQNDALSYTLYDTDGSTVLAEGVTEFSYTPAANTNGDIALSYTVSDGENTSAPAAITITVTPSDDPTTGDISIIGDAAEGQTLSVSNNLSDVDGSVTLQSYQWLADGVELAGETNPELNLTQVHVGKAISVRVVHNDGVFADQTSSSAATAAISNSINNPSTGTVTITGTASQDETLSFDTSALSDPDGPLQVVAQQWFADGVAISGETDSSLTLGQNLVGKAISVEVTVTDAVFNAEQTLASNPTTPVTDANDPSTGEPSITGNTQEDATLTIDTSELSDPDGDIAIQAYRWYADDVLIAGATTKTLVLSQTQVGKQISAEVDFGVSGYESETKATPATAPIENVNDLPTGEVTISGTPAPGQTLTASNSLEDEDGIGSVSYSWAVNGETVASGPSFDVEEIHSPGRLIVTASYEDAYGQSESIDSPPLSISQAPGFTVDGNPAEWSAIPAIITDATNDSLGNSASDIVSLKVSQDNGFHYLLLELAGDYDTFGANVAHDDTSEIHLEHYISLNEAWNIDIALSNPDGNSGAKLYNELADDQNLWFGSSYNVPGLGDVDLTQAEFAYDGRFLELKVPSLVLGDSPDFYGVESGYYDEDKQIVRYYDWDSLVEPEIVGTWKANNSPDDATIYFQFREDGTYTHAETNNSDPNGQSGYEIGSFTYYIGDDYGYFVSLAVSKDTNGEWGLSDEPLKTADFTLSADGNTLTLEGEFVLERVNRGNGIQGAWNYDNSADFVAFDKDGEYMFVATGRDDNTGNQIEWGTYTFDGETNTLNVTGQRDFNGASGLVNSTDDVDASDSFSVTLSTSASGADKLTLDGKTATADATAPQLLNCNIEGIGYSINQYLEVLNDCDMQSTLPDIGSGAFVGKTFHVDYPNELIVYDAQGNFTFTNSDNGYTASGTTNEFEDNIFKLTALDEQDNISTLDLHRVISTDDLFGATLYKVKSYYEDTEETPGADFSFTNRETQDGGILTLNYIEGALLDCNYEVEWDDSANNGDGAPTEFKSINDFYASIRSCALEDNLKGFSDDPSELAGKTFYYRDEVVTFNSDASAYETQNGDETYYATVENLGNGVFRALLSATQGGTIIGSELVALKQVDYFNGEPIWRLKVLWENYSWSESDGDSNDPAHNGGELYNPIWATSDDFDWDAFENGGNSSIGGGGGGSSIGGGGDVEIPDNATRFEVTFNTTVTNVEQPDLIEATTATGNLATMQCNPSEQVGDVDAYPGTLYLISDESQAILELQYDDGTVSYQGSYDASTGQIMLSAASGPELEQDSGGVKFYTAFQETINLQIDQQDGDMIELSGTTQINDLLTWDLDNRESECITQWSVLATNIPQ